MKSLLIASILATANQDEIENRALKIYESPVVQQQIEATRQRYLADPMAATPGGKATLENAAREIGWAAVLRGVNSEPAYPKIGWVDSAPRAWRGRKLPGARWAVDNPDNVYRVAPIDGVSRYEIEVRRHGEGPVQFSFLLYSHYMGEDGHQNDVDKPLGGLRDLDIVWGPNASFKITIDAEPANGRVNHIRSTPDARHLLIRNTLGDWQHQWPLEMSIKRVGGPPPAPPASDDELAQRSAVLLAAATDLTLNWKKKALFGHWDDNSLCQPYGRGAHWGFAASGNFNLGEDEALVVTVDPLEAKYIGFSVTDLWLASRDHVAHSGSLNGRQALRNPDGTYTYVIAARDPGVHNWLDTGGILQGSMLLRWQVLPESRTAAGAVKRVERVKLNDLKQLLPAQAMNPAARATRLRERSADYVRRYGPVE